MRLVRIHITVLLLVAIVCSACREHTVSDDPTLKLEFSTTQLTFDTVFTTIGSATKQVMVYNRNKNALRISSVSLLSGKYFHINLDGEIDQRYLRDIEIAGGDSMYLFVQVCVDPQASDSPVAITDSIEIHVNGNQQYIGMEAYGQDVHLIRTKEGLTATKNWTVQADKPYLIYDTVVVVGTTRILPGARLYFHQNAFLQAQGNFYANGTQEQPIRLMGDRLDNLFDSVPYATASGSWGGLFLLRDNSQLGNSTYELNYVDICSGNVGIYAYNEAKASSAHLTIANSRIHNQALYGLAIQNMDATVYNTEISNAASYCVYLSGGQHDFIHTTVASYFGNTDIRIQSTTREDVAAVYIDDLSKTESKTVSSFYNSIITGLRGQCLTIATPFEQYYPGQFIGNYIKADTLHLSAARDNTYWQQTDSAVFVNTFYKYTEYKYYDFTLGESSPARAIGDSLIAAPYPTDRLGKERQFLPHPDAGCYQY